MGGLSGPTIIVEYLAQRCQASSMRRRTLEYNTSTEPTCSLGVSFVRARQSAWVCSCEWLMKMQGSAIFCVATCILISLLTGPQAAVAQRDMSMFADPLRTDNWRAVEGEFMAWVERVEQQHLQSVKSSEATLRHKERAILAAGNTIIVGAGGFHKVQDAVDAAPLGARIIIQINAGTYTEKIVVPKGKVLTFQGIGYPVLAYGDSANSAGSTENSASTTILADDFIANGVTFQNTAPAPAGGEVGKQAIALRITGDKGAFYNCKFLGAQDTLYDEQGRHYFNTCYIEGSIDFICGDGQSLYQDCTLHSIAQSGRGSLTAQRRTGNENTGFSFVGCSITGSGPIYLGRAWGPSSRVVFIHSSFQTLVLPEGWYNWGDSSREKTVFYGQYLCIGPGAEEGGRVGWSHELTADQADAFSGLSFINGNEWLQS